VPNTLAWQGAFNSPAVYANPQIAPIIPDVLGGSMILGGLVSTCSLPGSQNMRVHKDHTALFPESENPDGLPSFTVTAVVPMRGFTQEAGTTRVWKRSHNCSRRVAAKMEWQDPLCPQGSILLMDYRLTHQGRANQSDRVRPILTMIYHHPWFRDIVNYGKQESLRISDEAYDQVPDEHKHLLAWTRPAKS
jgi:ectoine hydroxylase-related dioxygenase (phytanoyl-CoA dioxygenase family)